MTAVEESNLPLSDRSLNSNAANAALARASASPFQVPSGTGSSRKRNTLSKLRTHLTSAHSDDDGGDDYTSDGDIVSVTESLHFEEKNQGPLFNVSSGAGPTQPAGETMRSMWQ